MKRKLQEVQEDSDDGWLCTRNKRKISPAVPQPRKRKSFSRPIRPAVNHGNFRLTQNSPPPPQLKTATKQTSIRNFFGNPNPSTTEGPVASVLEDDDFSSLDDGVKIHDFGEGCYSNKKDNSCPGWVNSDQDIESPDYLSSATNIKNCGIEKIINNKSDSENLVDNNSDLEERVDDKSDLENGVYNSDLGNSVDNNSVTYSQIDICNDNLLEDDRREKHNGRGSVIEKAVINPSTSCNNHPCVAEYSKQEISSSSSTSSLSCLQDSEQNFCPKLQTKLPLRDRTNFLDSVQADFELNSMLPVSSGDTENSMLPVSSGDTENSMLPVSSNDTENSMLPVSSGDTENSMLPVSLGDTENSMLPVSSDDTENSMLPASSNDTENSMLPVSSGDTELFISKSACMNDNKYTGRYKKTKNSDFTNDKFRLRTKSHHSLGGSDSYCSQNLQYTKHRTRKHLIDSEDADLELQDFSLEC